MSYDYDEEISMSIEELDLDELTYARENRLEHGEDVSDYDRLIEDYKQNGDPNAYDDGDY